MALPSALLIIFSSVALAFGHLYPAIETIRGLRTAAPGEERKILTKDRDRQQRSASPPEDDPECQRGNPLGASYSGKVNHTISGRSCQAWSSSQPHEPVYTDVGKVGETETLYKCILYRLMWLRGRPNLTRSSTLCGIYLSRIADTKRTALLTLRIVDMRVD